MISSVTRDSRTYSLFPGSEKPTSAGSSFDEILSETTGGEILAETAEDELLKKAPQKWVTEAGFSFNAVEKALEFRRNELELEDPVEYSHELTAEQEAWLLSRHDLANMKRYVPYTYTTSDGGTQRGLKSTAEYSNFVADLVYLGVYSKEELVFQTEPIDTRSGSYNNGMTLAERFNEIWNSSGGSLFESSRSIVAHLENMYRYYYERSLDPSRAIKGDSEFAKLIKEHYMPFEKEFFEFIDRLLGKDKEQLPQRSVAPAIEDISEKLKEDFGRAIV